MSFIDRLKGGFKVGIEIVGVYVLWIVLHTIAANLYPVFCANMSFVGMIMSIFQAPSYQCIGLRWIINNGSCTITQMWSVFGTWIIGKLIESNMYNNN